MSSEETFEVQAADAPGEREPTPASARASELGGAGRSLRIIQIITRLNVGGPARHCLVLARHLRAQGFEALLVHGTKEPSEASFEDLLASWELPALKIPALCRSIRPWSDVRALSRLTRLMFRVRPDVVHTHTAKAGALGRLAAFLYNTTRRRSQRCLIVHTFHGHVFSGYFGRVGSSAVRVAERCMAWLTDCIITVSGRQQREICERYRIAPTWKTHIVEVGIDVEPLLHLSANSGLREELGFARHHVVFGYVGRFAPVKDLATLIRAFAQTAVRASAARLMLVGGGEQEAALAQLVADLRLTDRVRFAGWRRDVPAIYGALDIGVLTSLNEGTPLALMEAMAAGKPVVATTVGGVEDIVSHERTGLVVAPGDLAGLSDAMTRLTVDPVMRLRLGQTAQGEMVSRFGLDRVLSNVIGLYVRALADRRALQPLHAPRAESS